ncbi:hypothetical protein SAY86_027935 [Trapa natans]|uniref:MLO-like protein n=1 Tax=Trapa natans TaxID=22666 RepID=A0AAN7LZV6_TRANT|nr:hypothetical protein SAY86_027935 [Trapa natans]
MAENNSDQELRSLALTPTWSVATVLTIFVAISLVVERSIHRLSTDHEPFVSYQGLEQLHRFIFVMAVTHISYSCLTMLLAIVKIHSWRGWEDEAHIDRHDALSEITRESMLRRQSTFIKVHASNPLSQSNFWIWVNHNLTYKYDFHSYMIRSMEEEFQRIVGVSGPLWGFVVAFMLFNIKGSNLYFWIAIIPITVSALFTYPVVSPWKSSNWLNFDDAQIVLLVGAKLQHIIATLALENAGITAYDGRCLTFAECFRAGLILLVLGQFLCSYSTLPLYALVTQMGTNYKAALIPQRIRETIHGWKKSARRRRRRLGNITDDTTTIHTDTSTVMSLEEDDHDRQLLEVVAMGDDTVPCTEIELQEQDPPTIVITPPVTSEAPGRVGTPLLRASASISASTPTDLDAGSILRCASMPARE